LVKLLLALASTINLGFKSHRDLWPRYMFFPRLLRVLKWSLLYNAKGGVWLLVVTSPLLGVSSVKTWCAATYIYSFGNSLIIHADITTLKVEAPSPSEMLFSAFNITRQHESEDHKIHIAYVRHFLRWWQHIFWGKLK
jgi:hypothetical protein